MNIESFDLILPYFCKKVKGCQALPWFLSDIGQLGVIRSAYEDRWGVCCGFGALWWEFEHPHQEAALFREKARSFFCSLRDVRYPAASLDFLKEFALFVGCLAAPDALELDGYPPGVGVAWGGVNDDDVGHAP